MFQSMDSTWHSTKALDLTLNSNGQWTTTLLLGMVQLIVHIER